MSEYITIFIALALVVVWAKPLAGYMTAVYLGLPHPLQRLGSGLENAIYRVCGVHAEKSMGWRAYTFSVLSLGLFGTLLLFLIFMLQGYLPLNPQSMAALPWHTAFNAAISFVTNTNWQSYSGEVQLSYFSQTVGISVQHFISAATGMAVAAALCRAFAAENAGVIGNFWVDLVRTILYILLPLALLFGVILVSQGVVHNYSAYVATTSLEGEQGLIAQGPAGLQTAIKILGGNGGGFFAGNAAHPYENPNAITNLLQLAAILLVPVSFVYAAGMLMRDRRQGVMMLIAMTLLFVPLASLMIVQELKPNAKFDSAIIETSDGNIEGKETRFGVVSSALWGALATTTSNGSNNAAYDSFAALSGLAQLLFIQSGEVIFGGVGSGVYGMLVYVLMATFIAGLMVGRTPEFMGKKLTPYDVKMISIVLLLPAFLTLLGTALAVSIEAGRSAISNPGPHAFSQVLYAFSSASNNNGSALGGLNVTGEFFNITLGICMALGRYVTIICVLALAGSFAHKIKTPNSAGTLPTHSFLFAIMVIIAIIMLGLLSYIPALTLGPIAEYVMIAGGK